VDCLRTFISKTRNSAPRGALFIFAALILAACSSATRSLFFDIPPPKAQPTEAELAAAGQTKAASGTAEATEAARLLHPADREGERPPIEAVATWEEALELLPKDEKGKPDWAAAQREGIIMPRAFDPRDRGGDWFALDFYLASEKPKFNAYFPHSSHVTVMGCDSCHPALFPLRDNEITMKTMRKGENCGACHGKVAFDLKSCKRCHTNM
jgi:c(7)-type cytochrome triheme protein